MATIECLRNDDGNIEVNVTAKLDRIAGWSLQQAYRQLSTLQPRPIVCGFERNGSRGNTTCMVTIHGHTSNDGVITAIKAIGLVLSPFVCIDDIGVSGLARH